jgi:hypothetical protein
MPAVRLANACSNAVEYFAAALLLTAVVMQPSQAAAGHEGTSPTPTQSLSTVQDWSYCEAKTMAHDAESVVPVSPGDASATLVPPSSLTPPSFTPRSPSARQQKAPPGFTGGGLQS